MYSIYYEHAHLPLPGPFRSCCTKKAHKLVVNDDLVNETGS